MIKYLPIFSQNWKNDVELSNVLFTTDEAEYINHFLFILPSNVISAVSKSFEPPPYM
jgi:hypothetical protein